MANAVLSGHWFLTLDLLYPDIQEYILSSEPDRMPDERLNCSEAGAICMISLQNHVRLYTAHVLGATDALQRF